MIANNAGRAGNLAQASVGLVGPGTAKVGSRSALVRLANAGSLAQAALALAAAMIAAPVVRSTTSAMEDTVGRVWPFSLTQCGTSVECLGGGRRPDLPTHHLRTGSL